MHYGKFATYHRLSNLHVPLSHLLKTKVHELSFKSKISIQNEETSEIVLIFKHF